MNDTGLCCSQQKLLFEDIAFENSMLNDFNKLQYYINADKVYNEITKKIKDYSKSDLFIFSWHRHL